MAALPNVRAQRSNAAGTNRLRYVWSALSAVAVTAAAMPLLPFFDPANIVMLFLLMVVLVGVRLGRGPAVLAAVLGVAAFDFFLVPPRFSFGVNDVQYLLTFAVMLAVGLIVGQLAAGLKYQAAVASDRAERMRELYELARDLSGAMQTDQVASISRAAVMRSVAADAWLLVPNDANQLAVPAQVVGLDLAVAQSAYDQSEPARLPETDSATVRWQYLPLRASTRTRGVLAVRPRNRQCSYGSEPTRQLETFASLIAIALERVHYVEVAQRATVRIESERLRNSMLSALSHDLRTPLTALVGLSDILAIDESLPQRELAKVVRDEARRLSQLVDNLLEMARIESGSVQLRAEWQPIEEVIGSAIRSVHLALAGAQVAVDIAPNMPLVRFDAVMIERVIANLVENAAKYGLPVPPAAGGKPAIRIEATAEGAEAIVRVLDRGPGLPATLLYEGATDPLFEKFTRGDLESATSGLGLGLSICRAIIMAHDGRIWACNRSDAGAEFGFALPLGTPPLMAEPELPELHAVQASRD